jgi:hypothetical protein
MYCSHHGCTVVFAPVSRLASVATTIGCLCRKSGDLSLPASSAGEPAIWNGRADEELRSELLIPRDEDQRDAPSSCRAERAAPARKRTCSAHRLVTTMLDAGVDLRDAQIAARKADPRTTLRYVN